MIQEARYTSPGGLETSFAWETAKRKTELKTGVYTFPGRDGAHVQHQGAGARSFPLVCIFSGGGYMEKADQFEAMLIERGVGELQHPVYGTVKAVPTGDIEREDNPVNKLGEAAVTVTFSDTITDEETGGLTQAAAEEIDGKAEEFSEAAAADFAAAVVTSDITTQIEIISMLETQTQSIIDSLQPMAMTDKNGSAGWLTSVKELKDNIKNLYSKPAGITSKAESNFIKALNAGRLTLRLMKLPGTLAVSLSEKIKGYANLAANLINQYKNDPFGIEKIKAAYAAASLALTGACAAAASGSALTIAEAAAMTGATPAGISKNAKRAAGSPAAGGGGGAASRAEAVEAANEIAAFFGTVIEFQDMKIARNVFVDAAPAASLALSELVYSSVQLILNAAFALPMQKTITLDRDRQVIELCAELYGTTDYLDEFIIENNFNIDEIELLPMGKKVSYYVKNA
jgi:prophage DNA circulation protein